VSNEHVHPLFRGIINSHFGLRDGHNFVCDECGKAFVVPFGDYDGQFDHPPSVPLCDECTPDRESAP
jgi:hypothetical protein